MTRGTRPCWANVLSASRYVGGISGIALVTINGPVTNWLAVAVVILAALSDVVDGRVARRSPMRRLDGMVLDPLADDFFFFCSFLGLYAVGLVPLWLVIGVVLVRNLVSLVRLLTVVQGRTYASPRLSTKAKGVVYYVGLCALFVIHALRLAEPFGTALVDGLILAIAVMTAFAALDFLGLTHGRTLMHTLLDQRSRQPISERL